MNRKVSWIFGVLIALFIVGVPYEYYRYRYTTLKRLRVVDEGKLYRSGCLTADGFEAAIREYGIKTVINLQEEAVDPNLPKSYLSRQTELESKLCERLGVRYEFVKVEIVPYDKQDTQKPPTIEAFFKIMDDPTAWPVLIHCKAGLHRTGVMVALYRMEYDGWSVYEALEEMRRCGFDRTPSYSPNDYIRQYLANYVPRARRQAEQHAAERWEQQQSFVASIPRANSQTDRVRAITLVPYAPTHPPDLIADRLDVLMFQSEDTGNSIQWRRERLALVNFAFDLLGGANAPSTRLRAGSVSSSGDHRFLLRPEWVSPGLPSHLTPERVHGGILP